MPGINGLPGVRTMVRSGAHVNQNGISTNSEDGTIEALYTNSEDGTPQQIIINTEDI